MANDLTNLKDADLVGLLTTLREGLDGALAAYGLTEADAMRLAEVAETLQNALRDQEITEAAKLAATQQKLAARGSAIAEAQTLARRIYAHPPVTNAMLAEVGFEPRRGRGVLRTPVAPTQFLAEPNAKGFVKFSWHRNGNPKHTVYQLQQELQGRWITIAAISRQSVVLSGYAPGEEARFRVLATLSTRISQPSNEFSIYSSRVSLRAAA